MRLKIRSLISKFIKAKLVRERFVTDANEHGERLQQDRKQLHVPIVVKGTDTIEMAWQSHPNAKDVFSRYHLHSCHQCSVRFDETIEEAAEAYGFSREAMLVELNLLGRMKQ